MLKNDPSVDGVVCQESSGITFSWVCWCCHSFKQWPCFCSMSLNCSNCNQSNNKSCSSFWLPSLSAPVIPLLDLRTIWDGCAVHLLGALTGRALTPRGAAGWAVSFVAGLRPLPCMRHPVLLCTASLSADSTLRHASGKENLSRAVSAVSY